MEQARHSAISTYCAHPMPRALPHPLKLPEKMITICYRPEAPRPDPQEARENIPASLGGLDLRPGRRFWRKDDPIPRIDIIEVPADVDRAFGDRLIHSCHLEVPHDVLLVEREPGSVRGEPHGSLLDDHELVIFLQPLERSEIDESLVELSNEERAPQAEALLRPAPPSFRNESRTRSFPVRNAP